MAFVHSGNWTWEQYPPPYDFLFQGQAAAMPAPVLPRLGLAGLGCPGNPNCACNKGGGCKSGLGLFESGIDVQGWTLAEWAVAAAGLYMVSSLWGDTRRTTRAVRSGVKAARRELKS